jgi:hypothetical protein
MMFTPAGPALRPSPDAPPSLATANDPAARSSGRWLLTQLTPLTWCVLYLLLCGAVVLSWSVPVGAGGAPRW